MVRQIRRVYRPFLIRPSHAYFFPACLRPLPRRMRPAWLPDEEAGRFSAPLIYSTDYRRFPL